MASEAKTPCKGEYKSKNLGFSAAQLHFSRGLFCRQLLMRFFVLPFVFYCVFSASALHARANQPGHFGLGGILGEPTGVSAKYVATDLIAKQGALGLSIIERGLWLSGDV